MLITAIKKSSSNERLLFFLVCLLAIFNCFYKLSTNEVAEWDEARRGVAAYEMLQNSQYIVNTYLNQPDYWSVKPPAGLWLITVAYKVFSPSIFALRFPSALFAVFSIILVYLIATYKFSQKSGLVAAAILSTTFPFIFDHSARAGEYDAPLAFMITAIVASLLFVNKAWKLVCLLSLLFAIVFLLKSFTILIPLGIFIAWLCSTECLKAWKFKHTLIVFLISLLLISAWIIMRYQADGMEFFNKMLSTDLSSRTLSAIEGHQKGIFYHPVRILTKSIWWSIFAVFLVVILLKNKIQDQTKTGFTILAWVLIPLIAATIVSTKVSWYVNPIYTALAVILGTSTVRAAKLYPKLVWTCFFIALFCGELRIIDKIYKRDKLPGDQLVLRQIENGSAKNIIGLNWTQSQRFIAIVEKNLQPKTIQNIQDLKLQAKPEDLIYTNEALELNDNKLKLLHKVGNQQIYQYLGN